MKNVIITTSWDDGSVYDLKLLALLEKYNLRGTFYISKTVKEKAMLNSLRLLSSEEIKIISQKQEIGAHTLHHFDLDTLNKQQIYDEVNGSKIWLENIIKNPVKSFAYPRGRYNDNVLSVVKNCGFSGARGTNEFQDKVDDFFIMGISLKCYPTFLFHGRWRGRFSFKNKIKQEIKNIKNVFRYGLPITYVCRWELFAKKMFDRISKRGGIFHLSGHSWEIDKYNMWDELERIFAYIANRKDALYLTNLEVIEYLKKSDDKKNNHYIDYLDKYDSEKRFISYYRQIKFVTETNPGTVLEVGIGNKTVSDYLKRTGISVTTCDLDEQLKPDVEADIRNLPFKQNSFDTVLACQILEHLPFDDFDKALFELKRVSKKNIIISIPYTHYYFEAFFKIIFPFFERQVHFSIKVPFLKKKTENKKDHFWEMGAKNYSKKLIKNLINKHFKISREFKPILNSNRYFFILEKK